jgi:regulatory protein
MEHFEDYLNLAYRFLTIRNRSEKEIRDYLKKKNATHAVIEKVVASLKEKKFLDDEAFARAFVLTRARLRPKGKTLLKIELRQKGIAEEVVKKVLQEVSDELPDEVEQAKRLIARKMQQMAGSSRQEIFQKAGGFLSRRGFGWNIIKKAIDDSLSDRV